MVAESERCGIDPRCLAKAPPVKCREARNGHYGNIFLGLNSYFSAHGLQPLIVNFADNNGPAALYDDSKVANPHAVPLAFQRLKEELDSGRSALLHLKYWKLANRLAFRSTLVPGLADYDTAQGGAQVAVGPGGEQYGVNLGHTVTAVGYWPSNDPNNPFNGLGLGGLMPDTLIVFR
jgi:hypothetical protein